MMLQLPAKYCFVRLLKGTRHLTENTPRHWITWFACTITTTVIAYVIASAIPVFGDLVSLVGALLGTLMSFQPYAAMWLYDNWHKPRTLRWKLGVAWCMFVILSGTFLMIGGTYGSIVAIIKSSKNGSFSCADNSNSS